MAHGQIDPARLEGDALKRWYLRSPADIEAERSRIAARTYRDFFATSDQGEFLSNPQAERYEVAAAAPRRFWDYWGVRGCQNCHGYTPETLPPYGGHSPLPPNSSARTGGSGGSGNVPRRRSEWSERPQCNQQFEADREICQKAKNSACWTNQIRRLGHCDATGEVGTPALKFGPPGR